MLIKNKLKYLFVVFFTPGNEILFCLKFCHIPNKFQLGKQFESVFSKPSQLSLSPVLSGGPAVSVVGRSLFLALISNLPKSIKSLVRIIADNTIVYPTILTSHVFALCEVLSLHRKKKTVIFPYALYDTPSEPQKMQSTNLSWSSFINTITNKSKTVWDSLDKMSNHKTYN